MVAARPAATGSMRRRAIVAVGAVALLLYFAHSTHSVAAGARPTGTPVFHLRPLLIGILHRVQRLGWAGKPALAVAIVMAVVLCLPTTPLNVGAGFLFGWPYLPVLCVAAIGGAITAFLIGRTVLAPLTRSWLEKNELFGALDQLFEADQGKFSWRSLKLVLLLRASPLFPFTLINYSCGVSKLGVSTYCVGTTLGMLPWLVVDVYAGTVITDLAEVGMPRSMNYVAAIAVFTVVVTAYITVSARRFLAAHRRLLKKRDSEPALASEEGSLLDASFIDAGGEEDVF